MKQDILRYREALILTGVGFAGIWLAAHGGLFWGILGGVIAVAAAILGLAALRRMRFTSETAAPGLVEVVEGRIGYFGAGTALGGHVAVQDLADIRLVTVSDTLWWRLKTTDGQALLVPVQAQGAETLYDAFSALPGADMGRIGAALAARQTGHSLWRRAH